MTAVPCVEVRETHTAVVVLAGDRAYKAKKPAPRRSVNGLSFVPEVGDFMP
jgi:hypothetical protein